MEEREWSRTKLQATMTEKQLGGREGLWFAVIAGVRQRNGVDSVSQASRPAELVVERGLAAVPCQRRH
jgi:hypothetical protein